MAISNPSRSDLGTCAGGEPPMSQEVWDEAGRRLAAAQERSLSSTPRWCPGCGSRQIAPMFRTDARLWDCFDCRRIFTEGD